MRTSNSCLTKVSFWFPSPNSKQRSFELAGQSLEHGTTRVGTSRPTHILSILMGCLKSLHISDRCEAWEKPKVSASSSVTSEHCTSYLKTLDLPWWYVGAFLIRHDFSSRQPFYSGCQSCWQGLWASCHVWKRKVKRGLSNDCLGSVYAWT